MDKLCFGWHLVHTLCHRTLRRILHLPFALCFQSCLYQQSQNGGDRARDDACQGKQHSAGGVNGKVELSALAEVPVSPHRWCTTIALQRKTVTCYAIKHKPYARHRHSLARGRVQALLLTLQRLHRAKARLCAVSQTASALRPTGEGLPDADCFRDKLKKQPPPCFTALRQEIKLYGLTNVQEPRSGRHQTRQTPWTAQLQTERQLLQPTRLSWMTSSKT